MYDTGGLITGINMKLHKYHLLLVVMFVYCHISFATVINIDFTKYQFGTSITNQYIDSGVIFRGLSNPTVYIGAASFGNGSNGTGLTHSITNSFPGAVNGVSAYFINPISAIDIDVHASRIGSSFLMEAFDINGMLLHQYSYYSTDFYKGHASVLFTGEVSRIKWFSSEPNDTPVAIRNLSYKIVTVSEPATIIIMVLGMIGIGFNRKR